MSETPWFRFWNRTVHDPKVQTLSDSMFKFWVNCLCLASQNGGALPPVTDISFHLRLRPQAVVDRLAVLIDEHELFDRADGRIVPHSCNKWQIRNDVSAERVTKHHASVSNGTVGNVSETFHETPTATTETVPRVCASETDTDTEQKQSRAETDAPDITADFETLYTRHPVKKYRGGAERAYTQITGIESPEMRRGIDSRHAEWCRSAEWQPGPYCKAGTLEQWLLDCGWKYRPQKAKTEVELYAEEMGWIGGAQ